jgi:hypothetical protein
MTMNFAPTSGSLSPYAAAIDPNVGAVGSAPANDAYVAAGMSSAGAPTGYDPCAAPYEEGLPDAAYTAAVTGADPGVAASADPGMAASSTAPATTDGVHTGLPANIADFQQLGVLSEQELQQLDASGYSPDMMGRLYDEVVYDLQNQQAQAQAQAQVQSQAPAPTVSSQVPTSPAQPSTTAAQDPTSAVEAQLAAQQAQQQQQQQQLQAQSQGQGEQLAAGGPPGWNAKWQHRFADAFTKQGLQPETVKLLVGQLQGLGLPPDQLQQAFDYYTKSPQGKAELRQADVQVKAGKKLQAKISFAQNAGMIGLSAAGLYGTTKLARSQGNLVRALTRTAMTGSPEDSLAAQRMLSSMKNVKANTALEKITHAGKAVSPGELGSLSKDVIRSEARSAIANNVAKTNRAVHPLRKMALNGAVRNLTPTSRMGMKEALKYGVGMFPTAQEEAAKAAAKGGGAQALKGADYVPKHAANVTRTASGAVLEDASKIASKASVGKHAAEIAKGASGAAEAAEGARAASTVARTGGAFSKALGPIGLVAAAGFGIYGIKKSYDAEGGFGHETKKMTGNVAGGLAGGVAGAAAGAAIGSAFFGVGAVPGAIVGGIIGSVGGGWVGEHLGGLF